MARTRQQIKLEMTQSFVNNEIIRQSYELPLNADFETEFSIVSLENILFEVIALAIWVLEKLFDTHSLQVNEALNNQKAGRPNDYKNMALDFMYGFPLIENTDQFDTTGATAEQIANSKIIKYCSVRESAESARLIIKVASEQTGQLTNLNSQQLESFSTYMEQVKWAGVKLNIVNEPADDLKITMTVFRDPLVLDVLGNDIVNGGQPVHERILQYLKELDFNGELVVNDLIERLREVSGVENVHITSISSKGNTEVNYLEIGVSKIPVAGYFTITDFSNITYVV